MDSLDSINHKRGRSSNTESVSSIIKKAKSDKEVRIPCSTCNKTFIDHKRLNTHINKYHSLNTTIIRNSNGLSFVLSDTGTNKPDVTEFLSKFNMTVCVNDSNMSDDDIYLDKAGLEDDLIRRDRLTDGGGGVLIFIKKNIVRSKTEIK